MLRARSIAQAGSAAHPCSPSPMHQPVARSSSGIPPLIKRNTALFALSQSFLGAGTQLGYGIGPLMVVALTGSASLAGLTVALFGMSRFLVAYPVGRITDRHGRKPGVQLGLTLALVGTITVGLAMLWHGVVALVVGMLIFGMGFSAAQQMRVAAVDMFPPRLRALALGFVATGSLVGIVISPGLMGLAELIAARTGLEPIALPWLMVPALSVAGMLLVTFVHPDPREIGIHLNRYYPEEKAPPRREAVAAGGFSAAALWRNVPTRLAIISNCAGQGNMSIVMVLTSLVLAHHGHSLTAIALSHMFHTIGMFAFTIPLGMLADRFGRQPVMLPGVAITLIGAGLVAFTSGFWAVTLGTFLVGLGWAAANVAATALIADQVETAERGRAIGVADSAAGATSVIAAVITGPVVAWSGLPAAGTAAVALALVPLLLWV